MSRSILAIISLVVLAAATQAEQPEPDYYAVIQGDNATVSSAEFGKLEEEAYESFDKAEIYPPLIRAFAGTTERLWAVIYGEVFANLTDDDSKRIEMGELVLRIYDDAIEVESAKDMNIRLTRKWKMNADNLSQSFEMNFEMATANGLASSGKDAGGKEGLQSLEPLSIEVLAEARKRYYANWREMKLPDSELVRWQERVLQAGHFDAYNYWLFQSARPAEYEKWSKANRKKLDAWLAWRSSNAIRLDLPDFQRPLLSSDDPELTLLFAGRVLLGKNKPLPAMSKSFDEVIQRFEARFTGTREVIYCARTTEETLVYTAQAAQAKQSATVLSSTWSDAYYMKAYALLELGRLDEAQEALERALALSPSNSMYLAEMAYTHQTQKKWSEAIAGYVAAEEAAEAYSPDEVKASELSRALRGQGYALVELDRLAEAEALYRKAMAVDPEDRASAGEIKYIEQVRAKKR